MVIVRKRVGEKLHFQILSKVNDRLTELLAEWSRFRNLGTSNFVYGLEKWKSVLIYLFYRWTHDGGLRLTHTGTTHELFGSLYRCAKFGWNRCSIPEFRFWATVCKTVRPMLSVRCLSCPVCQSCLWRSCTVAKRLDGSRWNLACR